MYNEVIGVIRDVVRDYIVEPEVKFSDLFHETNERVPVSGLKWGVKVFAEVVHTLCESKLIK